MTKIQKPISLWMLRNPWLQRLALLPTKIQKPVSLLMLLAAICLLTGIFLSAVGAQEKTPAFTRVEGHGYEPAKVEPTDERINQRMRPTPCPLRRTGEPAHARRGAYQRQQTGQPLEPLATEKK